MAIGEEEFKPMSFRKLMQLKQIDEDKYESVVLAWSPVLPHLPQKRAFGGHVYAQSAWAASKTVRRGYNIHNVTGHFVMPVSVETTLVYHVRRIRDGGVYCVRQVEVYQNTTEGEPGKAACFISTISFKRDEQRGKTAEYNHQDAPSDHLSKQYGKLIQGKEPEDHNLAPGADANWWYTNKTEEWQERANHFPGVEIRKVDMGPYNGKAGEGGKDASRWRQLLFYRMRKEGPGDMDESNLNLHACAHMYASDRNGLFMIQRALGYGDVIAQMGSLSHTVIFNGSSEDMRMVDSRDNDKWFVQEAWTSASGENRGVHNSRLWDYEEGRIVAQSMQDGLVRIPISEAEGKLNTWIPSMKL